MADISDVRAAMLRRIAFPGRGRQLAAKLALYQRDLGRAEIERIQVERFNDIWDYCRSEVPFYRAWAARHRLPRQISGPADLADFPVLDKETIIDRSDEIFQDGALRLAYSTGGSTGQPTRYPRAAGESAARYAGNYLGRDWWGIRPFDPQVLLWGHSHLFGTGLSGWIARLKRQAADRIMNATRLNAYDQTEQALAAHYAALRRRRPVLLTGYTSAVFKLARYLERNGLDLGAGARLRAVILTAETVSDADVETIQRVFRAPAVIEYGAAETGVIAISRHAPRPLQVIWDSYVCLVAGGGAAQITTLDHRLFPLINYAIGDVVEPADVRRGNALSLRSVLGRKQDIVQLSTTSGTVLDLSAILPVHILKSYPGIYGVQFQQVRADDLRVHLAADRSLDIADVSAFFLRQLRKDHPDVSPASVSFVQVTEQVRTRAGKHALFVS